MVRRGEGRRDGRGDLSVFVKGGVALVVKLLVLGGNNGDRLELDVGCHAHVVLAVLNGAFEGGREGFRRVAVADAADAELLGDGVRDPHRHCVEASVLLGVGVDFRFGDGDISVLLGDGEGEGDLGWEGVGVHLG